MLTRRALALSSVVYPSSYLGIVKKAEYHTGNFFLDVEVPRELLAFMWVKGSVTINGVSLTINSIKNSIVSVGLIPETLARTNLGSLIPGDKVTLEADYFAKGLLHYFDFQNLPLQILNSHGLDRSHPEAAKQAPGRRGISHD